MRWWRLKFLAVGAIGLVALPVSAAGSPAQRLLDECRLHSVYCEAFLSAAIEVTKLSEQYVLMVSGSRWVCLPEALSYERTRELILTHNKTRPKDVVYPPGVYVMNVLEANFACSK